MAKKNKRKNIFFTIVLLAGIFCFWFFKNEINNYFEDVTRYGNVITITDLANREEYKMCRYPELNYKLIHSQAQIDSLHLIGFETDYGVSGLTEEHKLHAMILRCLRYKNISRKVERKYGLARNLLLAIMMQETGGVAIIPNSSNDGGVGLCHIQPSLAFEFGLRTYQDCKELRSTAHGKELRKLIKRHNGKISKLILYDDRFHPVLNLDAVGRMIAYYKAGNQIKDTPLQTAIRRYAGKYNFETYYKNIMHYKDCLNNEDIINTVKEEFEKRNQNLTINSEPAGFWEYINYCQDQNVNYGVWEYR